MSTPVARYDVHVRRQILYGISSGIAIAGVTLLLRATAVSNPTTVALVYLLVVLFVAAAAELWTAVLTSLAAMLCFNYFFLPPIGTFTIADPHNWVALFSFLIVSIVASQLSAAARARARDAMERRHELTRLFDLTRDILLTTEHEGALDAIARHVARRFELDVAAICVPSEAAGWHIHQGGVSAPEIDRRELDRVVAAATGAIEFDARTRAYGGHRIVVSPLGPVTLAPIRIGTRAIGMLATGGRALEAGTRDAVAGIVAIALERSQFLEDRRASELSRQRAELSSALLASLSHDLRTPLTAIRTAISNLDSAGLTDGQRRDQAHVASEQVERLTRLFEEILDMARIDAGGVQPQRAWTTPSEIVEAALSHTASAIAARHLNIDAGDERAVEIDPRLTATALAHLLENAARYAPDGSIDVRAWTDEEGLRLQVRDNGPGLQPSEMDRLFEPFYRGAGIRHRIPGTGMGLAITRGLLAAQHGRIWAENASPRGACFSIAVPARVRAVAPVD